uniref:AF2331-like domain-containing protein n=1 Tax=Archaeoglobus fulgidus TaxID=2234 RepID=A0A7C2NAK6_ARCFL
MPAYVFSKESFLRFLEGHLDDDVVIVVSSDITDFRKEKTESLIGEKDYCFAEFAIPADIFNAEEEELDELMKYAIVFVEKELLSEAGKKAVR